MTHSVSQLNEQCECRVMICPSDSHFAGGVVSGSSSREGGADAPLGQSPNGPPFTIQESPRNYICSPNTWNYWMTFLYLLSVSITFLFQIAFYWCQYCHFACYEHWLLMNEMSVDTDRHFFPLPLLYFFFFILISAFEIFSGINTGWK